MSPAAPRIKKSKGGIPFHIQEEIMKRLPVKSLIRFRSVSKAWKSLIDSSHFIAAHSFHRHTQPQHLLVWNVEEELNFVCYTYIDGQTFPKQRNLPTLPLSFKKLKLPVVVASSRGLLCLHGFDTNFTTDMFVLWNPSIKKSIVVANEPKHSFVGFGVCPVTNDPKIVSIEQTWGYLNIETSYRYEVMVYTLSSRKWRIVSTNLVTKLIQGWCMIVVVTDRFIYWRAETKTHNMIMSFDLTTESFEVIGLPDDLAHRGPFVLNISKLRDSLAIFQSGTNISTVWVMEDGAQRSFTKLFTINTPHNLIKGFRKNGIPIMELKDGDPNINDDQLAGLIVYEPNSEQNTVLDIRPSFKMCLVDWYVETLLLLGHSDCDSC